MPLALNPRPEPGRSRPAPARSVAVANRHPRLGVNRRALVAVVATLDAQAARFLGGCPGGELSLVLLTGSALAKIHADFMADPSATDVITFVGDATAGLAGEICVSVDTAAEHVGLPLAGRPGSARRQTQDLQEAFSAELTLYIVHGWLHLAGYDDLQPAMKRRMRAAEARAMKLLDDAGIPRVFTLRK